MAEEKKVLDLEAIEAQTALELPDRELLLVLGLLKDLVGKLGDAVFGLLDG